MNVARVIEFPLERRLQQQAIEPCPETEAKVLPLRPRPKRAAVTPFAGIEFEMPEAVGADGSFFKITSYCGIGVPVVHTGGGQNPWTLADPGAD